jgi:hypothetical protein
MALYLAEIGDALWLPRESRLLCEIEFAFGETALTGTGTGDNEFMAMGKAAPKNRTDGTGVKPNANVALTAAPMHSLFDQACFVMNGITVENQPNLYDTACAQLLTKVDIAGPDTSGSGMCNSLRKDHGRIYGESDKSGEDDYDHIQVAYERAAREAVLDTANSDAESGIVDYDDADGIHIDGVDSAAGRTGNFFTSTKASQAPQSLMRAYQARRQSGLGNP